jgi:hypothetical protein
LRLWLGHTWQFRYLNFGRRFRFTPKFPKFAKKQRLQAQALPQNFFV